MGKEEELVCSGELVAEAVRCELRSMMLEHGWTCLGQSIYVDSKFHQSDERTDLPALNVVTNFSPFSGGLNNALLHISIWTNRCHRAAPCLEICIHIGISLVRMVTRSL